MAVRYVPQAQAAISDPEQPEWLETHALLL
jgi:hypothetical protein